jgi:hypothetical protein
LRAAAAASDARRALVEEERDAWQARAERSALASATTPNAHPATASPASSPPSVVRVPHTTTPPDCAVPAGGSSAAKETADFVPGLTARIRSLDDECTRLTVECQRLRAECAQLRSPVELGAVLFEDPVSGVHALSREVARLREACRKSDSDVARLQIRVSESAVCLVLPFLGLLFH